MTTTDFNNWSKIADAFDEAISQVVRKCAFDLQGNMQATIRANNQVDTGFMTNTIYVRTHDESTYGNIMQPVKKGQHALEEVEAPPDNKTAYVADAASYGWYQNYGTTKIPARPFLEPAIETTRPSFELALSRIEDKLRQVS